MSEGAAEYYWANKTDISRQLASLTHSSKCRVLGRSSRRTLCRFATDERSLGLGYTNFDVLHFSRTNVLNVYSIGSIVYNTTIFIKKTNHISYL